MKRKLVFYTAFNSFLSSKIARRMPAGKQHTATTQAWTERRISIWQKYTLQSILNQAYEDFLYVLLLNPELKIVTEPLLPTVDRRVIYCYEDAPILERLKEYDELVLAIIDSDDMYSRNAGTIMMACSKEWMYFRIGYAFNTRTKFLYTYDTRGTGPFYAQRIKSADLSAFNRNKLHPCHEDVMKFKPTLLQAGNFCVVRHETNTAGHMNMINIGRRIKGTEIMRTFGVTE